MDRTLGTINIELVESTNVNFYRFFYHRSDYDNNDVYSINLDNIIMNTVDLDLRVFSTVDGLKDYLDTITNNTVNVSDIDILRIKNGIAEFLSSDKSCFEIILPITDDKQYSQNDIDKIYNAAVDALHI